MDSQTFNGGTFGPFASFGDGNVFIGSTFIAPVTFGAGNSFDNVTFLPGAGISSVGEGGTAVNSKGCFVKFDPTGTVTNFNVLPCGPVTLPDCVDCTSNAEGAAISTTGDELVVSSRGVLPYKEWCEKCGMAGVLWDEADVTVAPEPPAT